MKKILFLLSLCSVILMGGSKVVYSLDFSQQKAGDAMPWLKSKGFEFLLDSKALNLKFANHRLEFEATDEKAGLFGVRFSKHIQNIDHVVIEWGVDKFPQGANWAKSNNRVGIGAIFVLGTEKFRSGLLFAKPVPYFLAPFIGQKEKVGKQYLGMLYKKGGRYYCVSNKTGLQKTRFNIDQKFKDSFGKTTPPLTAFAFQMNTEDTQGGAKAFIKKITFYSHN